MKKIREWKEYKNFTKRFKKFCLEIEGKRLEKKLSTLWDDKIIESRYSMIFSSGDNVHIPVKSMTVKNI